MKSKKLNTSNKLLTPQSGTTVYIDYLEDKKVLEVGFTATKSYHYFGVEPEVWLEYKDMVLSGGSSGEFVNKRIKPYFDYKEIN